MYSVKSVQSLFQFVGIPANEEVIRRWCREGILKATKQNRYKGLEIDEQSVHNLLEKKLKVKAKKDLSYKKGYDQGFSDAKKIFLKKEQESDQDE